MPIITAANAPYSSVPTQSPSPTTGADFQNISGATPEAFGYGVGQAESKLGTTAEEAANRLEARAVEQQQLINRTAANNSTNWVMDEAGKILHGDPNKPGDVGFYGLKGLDAVNARQGAMQNIDAAIQSARGKLTNQRQILEFDNETRRQRSFWSNEIGRHYDQQLTQSAINSATAGMKLAGNGASMAAANGDWDAFNHKVEDQMKYAIDHNKAVGGTTTMLDEKFQEIRGAATAQWVESLVEKNPTQARDFLEANKDALVANEYHRLQGMVRAGADKAEVNRAVFGPPKGSLVQGGKANIVSNAVNANIPPEGRALLDTIAGPESGGAYNARWPGKTFSSFAAHPRISEPGPEGPSTAAGRYELVASTWDPLAERLGLADFSPENQDAAAWQLAQDAYRQQKGGDLLTALRQGKLSEVQSALRASRQWDTANMNAFAANLQKYQGAQPALTRVSQVGEPSDILLNNRPLPQREANEIPDAEIPGVYFLGNMTLTQKLNQLAQTMPNNNEHDATLFASAVKAARAYANGQFADQQHSLKAENDRVKAANEAKEKDYVARIYPLDGSATQVTETQIANDPMLTAESRTKLINFYRTATKPEPSAPLDKKTTAELFERVHSDWGSPNKIVDMRPIDQAFGVDHTISKTSYDWLQKQVMDSKTVEGEALGTRKKNLVETYKRAITKSNPMLRATDDEGDVNYGRYQKYVDEQVEKRKAENKNPYDLFTEGGPEYLGRLAVLRMFQKPLQSSIKSITEQLQANPNYIPPGTAIPSILPTVILPRLPGESAIDWEKRKAR